MITLACVTGKQTGEFRFKDSTIQHISDKEFQYNTSKENLKKKIMAKLKFILQH